MSRLLICLLALSFAVIAQRPDPTRWRSYSGYGNNIANPTWGSAGNRLRRQGPAVYGDGISSERLTKAKTALPSARLVSNIVHPAPADGKQPQNIRGLTDYLTYWGQFMDHDLDLTGGPKGSAIPLEPMNIPVPSGDPFFDPNGTGNKSITIYRSVYDPATSKPGIPREQITLVSSYMDGSQVYGSDNDTASSLRTFSGGLMKTTILNGLELPPLNTDGITNANDAHVVNDTQLYLLGDVRGNENPALTALHTLFLREHNRRARQLASWYPSWTDEELYQEARRYVIALLQHITFDEYLPLTVGDGALAFGGPYAGYNASVDATVATEFSTGAFRYGHSEVAEFIWRVDANGKEIPEGHLRLKDSYFNSPTTIAQVGVEPILRGLAQFTQNAVDIYFIDDLRNYLFGQPGQGGFDLAAVNIQRSRDHGLPGFNDFRAYFGLPPYKNWNEINPDPVVYNALSKAYASIDDCDVYVCGLAEFHDYANVGATFHNSIIDQYLRFRDGDRFWYDQPSQWNDTELAEIKGTTLSDVIIRNTPILRTEIQCFVFAQADGCGKPVAVPPPTVYTKYDYNITLVKKTKAHPFYGMGHSYGFAVNGVEGAVIEVQRGKVYHFNAQISCAHSFFITLVPEIGELLPNGFPAPNYGVGGDGDAFNQVTGNLGCIQMNRDLEFNCDREIPDWLYYNCDFHDYMGGVIKVTGTVPKPSSDATMATYQPIFLLFIVALALLF